MPAPETVDEYIAAQPAQAQTRLNELRGIFRAAWPDAAEVISYGMPTYKFDSGSMYFGAAKRHVAVYGSSTVALAEELHGFRQPKGTVRFPIDQPIPAELVTRLIAATVVERTAGRER